MSGTVTPERATDRIAADLERAAGLFAADVRSMHHEHLAACPGGKARCGYDIVYEVARVNRLVADSAAGRKPSEEAPTGWVRAPESYKSKDGAIADFEASIKEACEALAGVPEDRLQETVNSPLGPMPLVGLAQILPIHVMYHSGQLNYIQTLHGDEQFHWW